MLNTLRLALLIIFYKSASAGLSPGSGRPRKTASEMLMPVNSTMALMCEPVFNGQLATAHWFKDGTQVATVTSESNAVYEDRPHKPEQPMPTVGFLIISNVQKEDEGEYWCRTESGEAGEVFQLRIAYVSRLAPGRTISVDPSSPSLGSSLMAHCPIPEANPKPTVSWLLDGEPLSASSSDSVVFANGSLFLPRLSSLQLGRLECVVTNFAGKVSTHIQLHAARVLAESPSSLSSLKCTALFRSSVLWFLLGCLVTSTAVLLYLLCVLVLLRPTQSRLTLRPSMWLRSHPLLGPGFRKAVVPTPDFLVPPPHQEA